MRFPIICFAALASAGDLSCLWWGLIATPVAAYCYFANDEFQEVENMTVAAIEQEAEDVKDAGVFLIKHSPIVVAVNYGKDVITNGTDLADQNLRLSIYEDGQAGLGLIKEVGAIGADLADRRIALTRFEPWNDGVHCVLENFKLQQSLAASGGTQKEKRAPQLLQRFQQIDKNCFHTPGYENIAKLSYLNASNPDQKVGSTLADIASLLVPVEADAAAIRGASDLGAAGSQASEAISKYDLVLPSDVNTLRVIKNVDGKAASFDSASEATATRDKIGDSAWLKQNCVNCKYPVPVGGARRRMMKRKTNSLVRRVGGEIPTVCCNLPEVNPASTEDFDVSSTDNGETIEQKKPLDIYKPEDYAKLIDESTLVPPADFTAHDVVTETKAVLDDIDDKGTALLKWSPELLAIYDSATALKTLRNIFEKADAESSALYDLLEVAESAGPGRLGASTDVFMAKPPVPAHPEFEKLQQFSKQAMDDVWTTLKTMRDLPETDRVKYQEGIVYYYVKPTRYADRNPDPRGLHQDGGDLALASADTPGLVIADEQDKLSRLKLQDDTHYIIKGKEYGRTAFDRGVDEGLYHTVFGPEIVQKGRMSMIVTISKNYATYFND